jgi:hypothetical protein
MPAEATRLSQEARDQPKLYSEIQKRAIPLTMYPCQPGCKSPVVENDTLTQKTQTQTLKENKSSAKLDADEEK